MKSFEYSTPDNLNDATALLADRWGETEILAGGTDLVTSLKQLTTTPNRVVSLKKIAGIAGIQTGTDNIEIGAMTPLMEIVNNADVNKHFPALAAAAKGIGSPQILNAGTVGGDLCQRPRCWYYRNGYGLMGTHGETSLVRNGDNRYHAIFGNDGPALFVSPSSLGPALIALGAVITIAGPKGKTRSVPASSFFQTPKSENERETVLKPNEILTSIKVPISGLKNATYEVRHRHGFDWPYATASVAFKLDDGTATDTRVVVGHAAPVPWQAAAASRALNGQKLTATSATKSAEASTLGAKPLSGNGYKIQLVKTAVKRAIMAAAES